MNQKRTNKNEVEYKKLLLKCLNEGFEQKDRTGVGTYTLTNQTVEFDMKEAPLFTGKKIMWKTAVAELNAFLKAEHTLEEFHARGIKYWDKFADKNGELGPIYGVQWRNFEGVDQIDYVISELLNNPNSRRLIISAWNPKDQKDMSLPPCPVMVQFNVREGKYLDAFVYQRSADSFLGVPFDIFQYYLLTCYIIIHHNVQIRKVCGKDVPLLTLGKLNFAYGNFHIYANHEEQVKEYLMAPVFRPSDVEPCLHVGRDEVEVAFNTEYKHGKFIKGEIN